MQESGFKSYDELPLFLNSELVAKVLGVSPSSAYELMHEPGFFLCCVSVIGCWYPRSNSFNGCWNTQEVTANEFYSLSTKSETKPLLTSQ